MSQSADTILNKAALKIFDHSPKTEQSLKPQEWCLAKALFVEQNV